MGVSRGPHPNPLLTGEGTDSLSWIIGGSLYPHLNYCSTTSQKLDI